MSGRLESIFADVLQVPSDSINDATSPDNMPKWDSVADVLLTLAIEEAFGVSFGTKEIVAMQSVGLVKKFLAAKGIADV